MYAYFCYNVLVQSLQLFAGASYLFPEAAYHAPADKRPAKFGLSAGLSLTHRFNNWFDVESILSYERRGLAKSLVVNEYFTVTENVTNDYVVLSIVPTAAVFRDRLHVGLGGYVGKLIKSQLRVTFDSLNSVNYGYLKDASDNFKEFDAGIKVSLTYNAKLLDRRAFIRFVGDFGVTPINWTSNPNVPLLASIRRNNAITLCVGLRMIRSR